MLTTSSLTATVLIDAPSNALICTPPLPTMPKLAAVPQAKRLGLWEDHLTLVKAVGYLTPYCLTGLYMVIDMDYQDVIG